MAIDLLSLDTDQKLNSGYGYRTDPFTGEKKFHSGIDITLKTDDIPAVTGGTVHAVTDDVGDPGYMIIIRTTDGYYHKYMHMAEKSPLNVGDTVNTGDIIGTQGNTGNSTGKHLHFAVTDLYGESVDPTEYINNSNFDFSGENYNGLADGWSLKDTVLDITGKIIKLVAIILILIFAVYLFMKAFDISIV